MNIIIKQLQGGECSVEVSPTTKILEIKHQISRKLRIPVGDQKLLFLGRALIDDQTVESYPKIKNGTKLNLIVQKPEGLLNVAIKCFRKNGLSDSEALAKAKLLIKIVEEKVFQLSWDDIEKLSLDCLLDEYPHLRSKQELETDNEFEDSIGL